MAHFHEQIHIRRIDHFLNRLAHGILLESLPIPVRFAHSTEPVPFAERLSLDFVESSEGEVWGRTWESAWFQVETVVPESWAGEYVVLQADLGGEILVCDSGGMPICGLTGGSVFSSAFSKDLYHMLPQAAGGESVELWLEATCNGLFGVHRVNPEFNPDPDKLHGHYEGQVKRLRLCRFDYDAWQLNLDANLLFELAKAMPEQTARRASLMRGLSKAVSAYEKDGMAACQHVLEGLISLRSDPAAMDLYGVGHAHIDTGWLWPVRETVRKSARTFASQIGLIDRYPGYVFGASQPQHYQMVKDNYPDLYDRIKAAVAAGSWELQGCMWVEADCNVPSGESLVRQVIHGKNFFMDEFGTEVKNLWLPDVFGYSANLPQILSRAGVDYFLTQKLSWSKYNRFPHKTFIWEGIDGSRVLAHFPPEDTYNSWVSPGQLREAEAKNPERGIVGEGLSLFGIGNGGGGPKEEHVERALRARDLNGIPRFHMGHAQPVLERLAGLSDELDTWVGELYLEVHRGTLTTQAKTKKLMRRVEEALRAAEMLWAAADLEEYPRQTFDRLWKKVLINQFHDILPGSSIHMVYERTEQELADVIGECRTLSREAGEKLFPADPDKLVLFNPSSTPFADTWELPDGWTRALARGTPVAVQAEDGTCRAAVCVPAQSFLELQRTGGECPSVERQDSPEGGVLENDRVKYTFDAAMCLVSAFDKEAGRELIAPGEAGNVLALYEDRPHHFDAWDVDEYYEDCLLEQALVRSVESIGGPVRQGLRAAMSIGESTIEQTVWLRPDSKRLDFVTNVDWRERHKMLRVAFTTSIRAQSATSEVQYGHINRRNNRNTYWDHATFEAVAHRWIDISESDYGFALLNDCKYGHKALGGTLDLNLLRSPAEPDPVADVGKHTFTYSILPHVGILQDSGVFAEASMLNQGLTAIPGRAGADVRLPVVVEGDGVEMSVLKRAEKENCRVVRVVEILGRHTTVVLTAADPAARIVPTDLMEWRDRDDDSQAGRLEIALSPFEIATFKLK